MENNLNTENKGLGRRQSEDNIDKEKQQIKTHQKYFKLSIYIFLLSFVIFTMNGQAFLFILTAYVYPIVESFKMINKKDLSNKRRWFIYWLCFGLHRDRRAGWHPQPVLRTP